MDKSMIPLSKVVKRIVRDIWWDSKEDPGLSCDDPSLTLQSCAQECDINFIMSRFAKTGELPVTNPATPQYGDFSTVPEYRDALHLVSEAQERFNALDARIRARFDNDPGKFLEFASNPKNGSEMVALGLAKKRSASPQSDSGVAGGASPSPSQPVSPEGPGAAPAVVKSLAGG